MLHYIALVTNSQVVIIQIFFASDDVSLSIIITFNKLVKKSLISIGSFGQLGFFWTTVIGYRSFDKRALFGFTVTAARLWVRIITTQLFLQILDRVQLWITNIKDL